MLLLLLFYCGTWVIGGAGLYFLLRSVGSDPGLATLPFLGGISAVGAIVAVLAVFVPSGLGAREASMYGMLLALTTSGPALGAVVLNRLAITLVEILLFGAGVVVVALPSGPKRKLPGRLRFRPPHQPILSARRLRLARRGFDLLALRSRQRQEPTGRLEILARPAGAEITALCGQLGKRRFTGRGKPGRREHLAAREDRQRLVAAGRKRSRPPGCALTPRVGRRRERIGRAELRAR